MADLADVAAHAEIIAGAKERLDTADRLAALRKALTVTAAEEEAMEKKIERLRGKHCDSVDVVGPGGCTPLMLSCLQGNAVGTKALLELGATPTSEGVCFSSPSFLFFCLSLKYYRILLQHLSCIVHLAVRTRRRLTNVIPPPFFSFLSFWSVLPPRFSFQYLQPTKDVQVLPPCFGGQRWARGNRRDAAGMQSRGREPGIFRRRDNRTLHGVRKGASQGCHVAARSRRG